MSIQTNSLGVETVHYGFLNHEVFEELDFKTFSMGEPADVTICEFEDGSLLTARLNEKMINWSLEDLEQFPGTVQEKFSADLINCANHSNIHSMNQELEKIENSAEETPNLRQGLAKLPMIKCGEGGNIVPKTRVGPGKRLSRGKQPFMVSNPQFQPSGSRASNGQRQKAVWRSHGSW